jgi:glycosyl transferase family 25
MKNTVDIEDIYVINLDSSKKRLDEFRQKADAQNIPFKRWSAVNGREMSYDDFRKIGTPRWALQDLTKKRKGELGCYYSHFSLISEMSKKSSSSNKAVLIFEDDVRFPDNFLHKLHEALAEVPSDWDILFLGHEKSKFFAEPTGKIRKLKDFWGCHAYVVRKSSIPKFLPYLQFPSEPIDNILEDLGARGYINNYATAKPIAYPGTGVSDITDKMPAPEYREDAYPTK